MVEVANLPVPPAAERNPREWLYAVTLEGHGFPEDQALWLLAPHGELAMPEPRLTTLVHDGVLEVTSRVYCHGVHIDDAGQEVLVDNYFDLLPNVPRRIPIKAAVPPRGFELVPVMPIRPK
jgi:hypothetical protein